MQIAIVVVALVGMFVPPAFAAPDLEVPVTFKLTVQVPGRYWFKYALFDRDGTDAQNPGTEVWYESMDTQGPRLSVGSRKLNARLGRIGAPMGSLNPLAFGQQLWAQAFRWRRSAWVPCSARVKLKVQPYSLASVLAESAGNADALDGRDSTSFADASHAHGVSALGCYVKKQAAELAAGEDAWRFVTCNSGDRAVSCGSYTPLPEVITIMSGYMHSDVSNGSQPPARCIVAWRNDGGGTQTVYGFATCCDF